MVHRMDFLKRLASTPDIASEHIPPERATPSGSAETGLPVPSVLTVYGAGWCSDCGRVRRHLDAQGVRYDYVDLGSDPIAQALLDAAGIRAIPVVVTPDGRILIEPSPSELDAAIAGGQAA